MINKQNLSNRKKIDQAVIGSDHQRYHDPEYSDDQVEGLMRYFNVQAYGELVLLLKVLDQRKD